MPPYLEWHVVSSEANHVHSFQPDRSSENLQSGTIQSTSFPKAQTDVPPELLQEIFLIAMGLRGGADFIENSVNTRLPIWRVSWVCRSWRYASLSLPRLWSYLGLTRTESSNPSRRLDILREQLSRVQPSTPLHIFLKEGGLNMSEAFSLLVPHLPNASHLSLKEISADDMMYLATHVRADFSSLQHLCLSSRSQFWNAEFTQGATTLFQHCRALRYLNADSSIVHAVSIPWGQLTEYVGSYNAPNGLSDASVGSISQHATVLRKLKNVSTCSICFEPADDLTPPNSEADDMIALPFLKTLKIYFREMPLSVWVLRQLYIPSLETLTIGGKFIPTDLTSCLDRSGCSVRSLNLSVHPSEGQRIHEITAECVRHMPLLESLELSCFEAEYPVRWNEHITNLFFPTSTSAYKPLMDIAPRIRSLRINSREWTPDLEVIGKIYREAEGLEVIERPVWHRAKGWH